MHRCTILFKLGETDVFEPTAHDVLIDNLCARALDGQGIAEHFSGDAMYIYKATRPRAVRALLAHAGIALPAGEWITLPYDAAALKTVGRPWNPVIDRERCVKCGTCADYCVFGVYTVAKDKTVHVANPSHCKPGCPACARHCPVQAVIFPLCPEEPINGAEPIAAVDAGNAFESLAADPLVVLRARSAR